LQLHPLLLQEESSHCLIVREAMLRFFRRFSIEVKMNRFPLVFEG
jgi:hypothetical protein